LGASTITLAERLVAPTRAGRLDDVPAALDRLRITELPLREDAPAKLAQLRAEVRSKPPDCGVLLAARDNAGTVASFDLALIEAPEERSLPTVG